MGVWVVTLQITECESPSKYLSFATINDGYNLFTADANGQIIVSVGDEYIAYTINISVLGYISRNFALVPGMNGTIQNVCLNPTPPPPPDQGDIGEEITGW